MFSTICTCDCFPNSFLNNFKKFSLTSYGCSLEGGLIKKLNDHFPSKFSKISKLNLSTNTQRNLEVANRRIWIVLCRRKCGSITWRSSPRRPWCRPGGRRGCRGWRSGWDWSPAALLSAGWCCRHSEASWRTLQSSSHQHLPFLPLRL